MDYANLDHEDVSSGNQTMVSEKLFTKFCIMGFVYAKKWDITYFVVLDGVVRVYDSEDTFRDSPENFVTQYLLSHTTQISPIYSKDYSKNSSNPVVIFYSYLLQDNGFWSPTKLIKFGSSDRSAVERVISSVKNSVKMI